MAIGGDGDGGGDDDGGGDADGDGGGDGGGGGGGGAKRLLCVNRAHRRRKREQKIQPCCQLIDTFAFLRPL